MTADPTPTEHTAEVIYASLASAGVAHAQLREHYADRILEALTAAGLWPPLPDGHVRLHGTVWRLEEVTCTDGTPAPFHRRLVPVEETP